MNSSHHSTQNYNNKLFASFVDPPSLEDKIIEIQQKYRILYNKIFVLKSNSNNEYVCTYSVDTGNVDSIPEDTILVHRKKDTNTLYTINALNNIIIGLNGGKLNKNFPIEWENYRNSILLTQNNILKIYKTKIHKIIEVGK